MICYMMTLSWPVCKGRPTMEVQKNLVYLTGPLNGGSVSVPSQVCYLGKPSILYALVYLCISYGVINTFY